MSHCFQKRVTDSQVWKSESVCKSNAPSRGGGGSMVWLHRKSRPWEGRGKEGSCHSRDTVTTADRG